MEMDADDTLAKELDAVTANFDTVYDVSILRDLVHDVVQSIKRYLNVDWTQPHRE